MVVEKTHAGAAPNDPVSVMLFPHIPHQSSTAHHHLILERLHTSRLVTGFSSRLRCVSFVNFPKTSRSASSAKLFCVRIKAVKLGIEFARVGCMLFTRLRARRRV